MTGATAPPPPPPDDDANDNNAGRGRYMIAAALPHRKGGGGAMTGATAPYNAPPTPADASHSDEGSKGTAYRMRPC